MKRGQYAPFPDTHWSLVHRAGNPDMEARKEALGVLLQRYQPALESYMVVVRKLPLSVVEDLLLSFIADKFLQQTFLEHADAQRGRFRSFLLTSLNHYLVSLGRKGMKHPILPLLNEAEYLDVSMPSPAAVVEANWARALILNVIEAVRDECETAHRADIWAVFEGRILGSIFEHMELVSYERLASNLGLGSPTQAANLLVTAKRMYARLLHKAVGEYETEAGITDEIMQLRAILHRGTRMS